MAENGEAPNPSGYRVVESTNVPTVWPPQVPGPFTEVVRREREGDVVTPLCVCVCVCV